MKAMADKLKAGLGAWGAEFDAPAEDDKKPGKRGGKKAKVAIAQAATARGAPLQKAPAAKSECRCRIEVSKGGRGGKTVTVITGLGVLTLEDRKALLKKIKNAVAGGGKISNDGSLEVQGEHANTVLEILVAEGFTDSKISGGIPKKKK